MVRHMLLAALAAVMVLTSGAMALVRTAPDGTTIVICTGMGLATVTVDANGDEVDPSPICPECALQSAALLGSAGEANMPWGAMWVLAPAPASQNLLSFEAVRAAARGPPVLA